MSLTELIASVEQGLARDEAQPARLGRRLAQHRLRRPSCKSEGLRFHLILNAYWEPLDFELPPRPAGGPWRRWIDTSRPSPEDIVEWKAAAAGGRRELTGPGRGRWSCCTRRPR